LLHEILKLPYSEIKEIIGKYESFTVQEEERKEKKIIKDLLVPFDTELPELHRQYLIGRNFDPDFIQKKYLIRSQYKTGFFAYRIIIPIIEDNQVVNLTGRDVTGLQKPKYKNLHNNDAVLPMKICLYNIDSVRNTMVICEGPTDVWRMGDGAVATMGVEFTTPQVMLISQKKPKNVFIMYDPEAQMSAYKLANHLSSIIDHVEIIELKDKDPGELSEDEVKHIRKELGL
jgi:DNA primase